MSPLKNVSDSEEYKKNVNIGAISKDFRRLLVLRIIDASIILEKNIVFICWK